MNVTTRPTDRSPQSFDTIVDLRIARGLFLNWDKCMACLVFELYLGRESKNGDHAIR